MPDTLAQVVDQAARGAIIFAGVGHRPTAQLIARLNLVQNPFVVAADGGADVALELGFVPDLVVGDLDSVSAPTLERLIAMEVPIERFPRDKDATDGELAVQRVLEHQPASIALVGFLGGERLDHGLANVLMLTRLPASAELIDSNNTCRLIRAGESFTWEPDPTELVSLLPLSSDATGVSTAGLAWPLSNATLRLGDTLGVSNQPTGDGSARVSVGGGMLLLTRFFPGV